MGGKLRLISGEDIGAREISYGFVGAALEARLALGELEAKQKIAAAAAHLQALRRDAEQSGFELILGTLHNTRTC